MLRGGRACCCCPHSPHPFPGGRRCDARPALRTTLSTAAVLGPVQPRRRSPLPTGCRTGAAGLYSCTPPATCTPSFPPAPTALTLQSCLLFIRYQGGVDKSFLGKFQEFLEFYEDNSMNILSQYIALQSTCKVVVRRVRGSRHFPHPNGAARRGGEAGRGGWPAPASGYPALL